MPTVEITANNTAQFTGILSGTGDFGIPSAGIHVLSFTTRNYVDMQVLELISPSKGCVEDRLEFGYYTLGNSIYFGIHRIHWSYVTELLTTSYASNDATPFEEAIKIHYHETTAPEGWTTVPIKKITLQE